jgi:hypothetical protein
MYCGIQFEFSSVSVYGAPRHVSRENMFQKAYYFQAPGLALHGPECIFLNLGGHRTVSILDKNSEGAQQLAQVTQLEMSLRPESSICINP